MRFVRLLRSRGVEVLVWMDDSSSGEGFVQRTKRQELTVLLSRPQTPKRAA
jgi:hypothetical protein